MHKNIIKKVITMELQIQDLVSSIKQDGIDSANREAAAIVCLLYTSDAADE